MIYEKRKDNMRKLTKEQKRQISTIAAKKEADIDLTDMPEVVDWRAAEVGRFYRPARNLSRCGWTWILWNGSRATVPDIKRA